MQQTVSEKGPLKTNAHTTSTPRGTTKQKDKQKFRPCTKYEKNICSNGVLCNYIHQEFPCLYFYLGIKCPNDQCKFLHNGPLPQSKLCAFIKYAKKLRFEDLAPDLIGADIEYRINCKQIELLREKYRGIRKRKSNVNAKGDKSLNERLSFLSVDQLKQLKEMGVNYPYDILMLTTCQLNELCIREAALYHKILDACFDVHPSEILTTEGKSENIESVREETNIKENDSITNLSFNDSANLARLPKEIFCRKILERNYYLSSHPLPRKVCIREIKKFRTQLRAVQLELITMLLGNDIMVVIPEIIIANDDLQRKQISKFKGLPEPVHQKDHITLQDLNERYLNEPLPNQSEQHEEKVKVNEKKSDEQDIGDKSRFKLRKCRVLIKRIKEIQDVSVIKDELSSSTQKNSKLPLSSKKRSNRLQDDKKATAVKQTEEFASKQKNVLNKRRDEISVNFKDEENEPLETVKKDEIIENKSREQKKEQKVSDTVKETKLKKSNSISRGKKTYEKFAKPKELIGKDLSAKKEVSELKKCEAKEQNRDRPITPTSKKKKSSKKEKDEEEEKNLNETFKDKRNSKKCIDISIKQKEKTPKKRNERRTKSTDKLKISQIPKSRTICEIPYKIPKYTGPASPVIIDSSDSIKPIGTSEAYPTSLFQNPFKSTYSQPPQSSIENVSFIQEKNVQNLEFSSKSINSSGMENNNQITSKGSVHESSSGICSLSNTELSPEDIDNWDEEFMSLDSRGQSEKMVSSTLISENEHISNRQNTLNSLQAFESVPTSRMESGDLRFGKLTCSYSNPDRSIKNSPWMLIYEIDLESRVVNVPRNSGDFLHRDPRLERHNDSVRSHKELRANDYVVAPSSPMMQKETNKLILLRALQNSKWYENLSADEKYNVTRLILFNLTSSLIEFQKKSAKCNIELKFNLDTIENAKEISKILDIINLYVNEYGDVIPKNRLSSFS